MPERPDRAPRKAHERREPRSRDGRALAPLAGVSNHALARVLQRKVLAHTAPSLPTPRKAFDKYLASLNPRPTVSLPKGLEHDPKGDVERPERVEAKIDADDIRTDDRADSDITTKVTGMAKTEQFLTQGTAYSGTYHGGHLIADQLMGQEDSFVYWNVAPQWGTFNTPEYRKMERLIVTLAGGAKKKKAKTTKRAKGGGRSKRKKLDDEPKGKTLMVTAKVTYGEDTVTVPATWLRSLGVNVPKNAPDLTFPRRTPRAWTLRARAKELPKKVPKTQFVKSDWQSGLDEPLPSTGFTTRTGYSSHAPRQPGIEHRKAGKRGASPKSSQTKKYPSAKYAPAEMWKMRTIQWVPRPEPPRREEVNSIVEKWFPSYDRIRRQELAQQEQLQLQFALMTDAYKLVSGVLSAASQLRSKLPEGFGEFADEFSDEAQRLNQGLSSALMSGAFDREEIEEHLATLAKYVDEAPAKYLEKAEQLVAALERQRQDDLDALADDYDDSSSGESDDDLGSGDDHDQDIEEDDDDLQGELVVSDSHSQPTPPPVQGGGDQKPSNKRKRNDE